MANGRNWIINCLILFMVAAVVDGAVEMYGVYSGAHVDRTVEVLIVLAMPSPRFCLDPASGQKMARTRSHDRLNQASRFDRLPRI
jgi:hypothetical protein